MTSPAYTNANFPTDPVAYFTVDSANKIEEPPQPLTIADSSFSMTHVYTTTGCRDVVFVISNPVSLVEFKTKVSAHPLN